MDLTFYKQFLKVLTDHEFSNASERGRRYLESRYALKNPKLHLTIVSMPYLIQMKINVEQLQMLSKQSVL